jgi:prepilin-type N-terminal cleavage/methylation domain-containing protein
MRGFTLIELMVAVAMSAIAVGALGAGVSAQLAAAGDQALRERALQALESEADAAIAGLAPPPALRAALLAVLPGGRLAESRTDGVRTFTVRWHAEGRPAGALSLSVLERGVLEHGALEHRP